MVFVAAIVLQDVPPGGVRFVAIVALVLACIVPLGLVTESRKEGLRRWLQAHVPGGATPRLTGAPHA
jgi:hypothetical protein